MSRIVWKPEHRQHFLDAALEAWPTCDTYSQCSVEAMKTMPLHLRRNPLWPNVVKEVSDHIRKHKHDKTNGAVVPPPRGIGEEPVPPAAREEVVVQNPAHVYVEDQVVDFFVNVIERILTHPATLLAARTFVQSAFERETKSDAGAVNGWPESVALKRNPKVLIVGPRDREFSELVKQYGDRVALRYWNVDKSRHQLKLMAPGADVILLLTTRTPHHVVNSLRFQHVDFKLINNFTGIGDYLKTVASQP